MTEYVAGGGDGFKIIAENKEKHLQVRILNMIYEFRKCHFAGENWNISFINLDNVTLQGPLDTDILREYIKARSPLNYK